MPFDINLNVRQQRYKTLTNALQVLGHPTRLAILDALADGPASPNQLSIRGEMALGSVAYHVRTMADSGLIELQKETRKRGAIEHTYKLSRRGRKLWKDLGLEELS